MIDRITAKCEILIRQMFMPSALRADFIRQVGIGIEANNEASRLTRHISREVVGGLCLDGFALGSNEITAVAQLVIIEIRWGMSNDFPKPLINRKHAKPGLIAEHLAHERGGITDIK